MKKSKIKIAHVLIVVCITGAVILLCFLWNDIIGAFGGASGNGTVFEFTADGGNDGFRHEAMVYTGNGITSVTFSGTLTTDGAAEITFLTEEKTVLFSKQYPAAHSEAIEIEVKDLIPETYYILRFSSNEAGNGHLILSTDQALAERPERPEHTTPTIPERNTQ